MLRGSITFDIGVSPSRFSLPHSRCFLYMTYGIKETVVCPYINCCSLSSNTSR